jgi:Bacterial Ig-like domain (group 3)
MQRIHRSRSFAPALNPLEGRLLLSGASHKASFAAIHGGQPSAQTATEVVVTDQGVYNKKHVLTAVTLMAQIKPLSGSGVPTGTVTFDMVMPARMKKVRGMKPGTTVLGTVALTGGEAMLTVKPRMVLKMPLQIIYSGDAYFTASTATPPMLTKAGLRSMNMGMGTGMKM